MGEIKNALTVFGIFDIELSTIFRPSCERTSVHGTGMIRTRLICSRTR